MFPGWISVRALVPVLVLCLRSVLLQQTSTEDGFCAYHNNTRTQVRVPVVTATRWQYCDWWGYCRNYFRYQTTYRLTTQNLTLSGRHCCPGYRPEGGRCILGCAEDRWGIDCAEVCTCNITREICDDVIGTCLCRPGLHGNGCREKGRGVSADQAWGDTLAAVIAPPLLLLAACLLGLFVFLRRRHRHRLQEKLKETKQPVPQTPAVQPAAQDGAIHSAAAEEVEMASHAASINPRDATPKPTGGNNPIGADMSDSGDYNHLRHTGQTRDSAAISTSGQLYHHLAVHPAQTASGSHLQSETDFEEAYDTTRVRHIGTSDPNETYHHLSLTST